MDINLILFCIADALDDLWTEMAHDDYTMSLAARDEFNYKKWDSTSKAIWLSQIKSFDAHFLFWLHKEEPPRPFFEVRRLMYDPDAAPNCTVEEWMKNNG